MHVRREKHVRTNAELRQLSRGNRRAHTPTVTCSPRLHAWWPSNLSSSTFDCEHHYCTVSDQRDVVAGRLVAGSSDLPRLPLASLVSPQLVAGWSSSTCEPSEPATELDDDGLATSSND
jgi:hypothetical protein